MNLQQHWLPLRRFAGSPDRWYNLNSLLNGPEWLSSTYLSLAINTAEDEGHSVFVVRKAGDNDAQKIGFSALPECQADLMGLQLGSPSAGRGAGVTDGEQTGLKEVSLVVDSPRSRSCRQRLDFDRTISCGIRKVPA